MKYLIIGFALSVCLFYYFDKKGFYYGLGCSLCSNSLPYEIKPFYKMDYPQEFQFLEKNGMELVNSNTKFRGSDFVINQILEYSYNDSIIILKVIDKKNNYHYIESNLIKLNNNKKQTDIIHFKTVDSVSFLNYNTVVNNIKLEKILSIQLLKGIFFLISILSFFFLIFKLYKKNFQAKEHL